MFVVFVEIVSEDLMPSSLLASLARSTTLSSITEMVSSPSLASPFSPSAGSSSSCAPDSEKIIVRDQT